MPLDVCLPTLAHVQDDENFSLDPPDPMPVAEETAVSISDEDAGGEGHTRRKTKASAPAGPTPQCKTDSSMFMYVHVAHDYLRDCIDRRPAGPNIKTEYLPLHEMPPEKALNVLKRRADCATRHTTHPAPHTPHAT